MPDDAARLLSKLRTFVDGCTPEERALLAVLLAPGINALADTAGDDVLGFSMGVDTPDSLAAALTAALERGAG